MSGRIKRFIGVSVLLVYVLGCSGCAAGWFLVGAGVAGTVVAVVNEADKQNEQDEDIK